jgi:presqualene diphosphate synthase
MPVSESISVAQSLNERALPATGSSFYTAMRVLPAAQRQAMFDIYAFCRAVDDIADGDAPAAVRRVELEQWRRDIDACYAGKAPVRLLSLHRQIVAFDLAHEDFHAVIEGMMMDVDAVPCAPDASTLETYCDRVASAVGRLSVKVFGMQRDDGVALAHHLGRALQMTNILRDIDEDADIGRVYLPRQALLAAGVRLGAPADIAAHPAVPAACAILAAQAQEHFEAAMAIMRHCPRRAARAPRIMAAVYHELLVRLLARGWNRPRQPVKIPKLRLISIVLRHAFI